MNDTNKASAIEVLNTILKRGPSKRLNEILERMFNSSKKRQEAKGVSWKLSYEEYLDLITQRRLRRMEDELRAGNLRDFMNSDAGYVLTTKTRAAYEAKVYDKEAVEFVNRSKSLRNHRFNKGDRHSDYSKQIMSDKRMGFVVSEETKEKIRAGNKGVKRSKSTKEAISKARTGKVTDEATKAKQAEAMRAYHAARRAAKENNNA